MSRNVQKRRWITIGLTISLAIVLIPLIAWAQTQNYPPVANAGGDRRAYTGVSITLYGSATDPDGDPILSWEWALIQKPAGARPNTDDYRLVSPDSHWLGFYANIPGDYVFSLTVSDGTFLGFGTDYATVHVADNVPPTAVATADKAMITAGGTVCFDGSQSYDPEGGPLTYQWLFGDASPSVNGVSTCHTYAAVGTYNAYLAVNDERGASDTDLVVITVQPLINHPPVASPSTVPNTGDAPLTVQFTANASDPDNNRLTYAWDFGDPTSADNTSTAADPSHVYQSPGTYAAGLTVSDGQLTASYSFTITVSAKLSLSTRYASVLFWNKQKTMGNVRLWADFEAPRLTADDVIAVTFDKITLFAVPFSRFKPGLLPEVRWYVMNGYTVRIDFAKGQLYVSTPKIALSGLDNSNGVDVELRISGPHGMKIGLQNIMMTPEYGTWLLYHRSDTTGDPM